MKLRSSLLIRDLTRKHLKLHQITILSLTILVFGVLFSTTSPVYADSVQVIVAQGTSSNSNCGDQCFVPNAVSIAVGNTITWKNSDSAAHTVTSGNVEGGSDGNFDSGLFLAGKTFSHKFDTAGTFDYYCIVHPWMKGTVIVGDPSVPLTPITPSEEAPVPPQDIPTPTQLIITGTIASLDANNRIDVTLRIVGTLVNGQSDNIVTVKQIHPNQNGSYESTFTLSGPLWVNAGDYKVIVNYGALKAESVFTFDGKSDEISVEIPTLGTTDEEQPTDEEILAASTQDGSIYAIITPTRIDSHQNLTFELAFEDADDKPIAHVNFEIVAMQDNRQILYETGQHTHSGTVKFTTATLNSDDPVDIQVRILGIGLPDDTENWTMATKEILELRIVDFDIRDESEELLILPYSATVSIPEGSSTIGCERTNQCYIPAAISIAVGGEVVWSNDDSAAHTITSGDVGGGPDGKFNSDLFLSGKTFSHKFDEEGAFPYFCQVHPWMKGIVYVGQGNPNPSPTPSEIELYTSINKLNYDLGELVSLNVNVAGISSPQNVAFTVTDPFGTIVVSRTLTTDATGNADTSFKIAESFKTGTYHIDATMSVNGKTYSDSVAFRITSQFNQIQIVSAQGTDQQGNPVSFTRGNMGFVKVQVSAEKGIATLITVNVFDSDLTPIGVGSLKTTLSQGQSELILSFLIPQDAVVGTADIYVNALSDWVSAGGIPQTGEFAGQAGIN